MTVTGSDGKVMGASSGSRASTEPCSTVSALTGFDPARKGDAFSVTLDIRKRRAALENGEEAALALEWLTSYGANVLHGGYGDQMRGADEGKEYHQRALEEFANRINGRAIDMAVADVEAAYASAIEARSDVTPQSGAAEGESATRKGDAQTTPAQSGEA